MKVFEIEESLKELHGQAMHWIRNGSLDRYREVNETYQEVILTFASVGSRFGVTLVGPIDQLSRYLYEEITESLSRGGREIAFEAVGNPYSIALRILDKRSEPVIDAMLRLLVDAYEASRSQTSDVATIVGSHAALELEEFMEFVITPRFTGSTSEREWFASLLGLTFSHAANLGRAMIDATDRTEFSELLERWMRVLEHWSPEYAHPDRLDLQMMQERLGESHQEVIVARAQILENEKQAELKKRLEDKRTHYLMSLLVWALRRPRGEEGSSLVTSILDRFPTLQSLLDGIDVALEREWTVERSPLSHWVYSEAEPRSAVQSYAADLGLFRTMLVTALTYVETANDALQVRPRPWVRLHLGELASILQGVESTDREFQLLAAPPDFDQRKTNLLGALQSAAEVQNQTEREQLRAASLSANKIAHFRSLVTREWRASTQVPTLFKAAGIELTQGVSGLRDDVGISNWFPKALFVEPTRLGGLEGNAAQLGRVLGGSEMKALVDAIDAVRDPASGETLGKQIANSARQFESSHESTTVVLPYVWSLRRELSEVITSREPASDWSLEETELHAFVGLLGSTPVFFSRTVPDDSILLLDLRNFCEWTYFFDPQEDLPLRIESFNAEEAQEISARSPEGESSDLSERVQESVRVFAPKWWDLVVRDEAAAVRLQLPEELI